MYHNCIFCSADLGTNTSGISFPVGRQIAFDSVKGRLWAVCLRCGRWNLAPIEDRWEPIEEAEETFRRTPMRVHDYNIGLARLSDGTRLVRVGEALPGELAAWRYGNELRRRRRAYILAITGAGLTVGALATLPLTGVMAGGGIGAWGALRGLWLWRRRKPVYRLADGVRPDEPDVVRRWHLEGISVRLNGSDELEVVVRDVGVHIPHLLSIEAWLSPFLPMWGGRVEAATEDVVTVSGSDAHALLRRSMVQVNGAGASRMDIVHASGLLAEAGSAQACLSAAARNGFDLGRATPGDGRPIDGPLALAIEMALNEESERKALEGELSELEAAWREAEEIAAIADSLPDSIRIPMWMR